MSKQNEIITDFAGNQYPASALNEQESPGFDVHGARKDRAMQALGEICQKAHAETAKVGDEVEIIKGRKHNGKKGRVFWRGADAFNRPSRYTDDLSRAVLKSIGNYDRIGVETESGEKFFVPLPYSKKTTL